jgi:hypothetical protein
MVKISRAMSPLDSGEAIWMKDNHRISRWRR